MAARGVASLEGRVAASILTERRRELGRSARIIAFAAVTAAAASILTALATWALVWFGYLQTRADPNQSYQRAGSIASTPSPQPK